LQRRIPDGGLYDTSVKYRIPGFDFKHFVAHELIKNPNQELEYFQRLNFAMPSSLSTKKPIDMDLTLARDEVSWLKEIVRIDTA